MSTAEVHSIEELRIQRKVGQFTAKQLLMYRILCAKVGADVVHQTLTTTPATVDELFNVVAEYYENKAKTPITRVIQHQ